MFGLFKKKKYSLLTSEMLEPVDMEVTTQAAKQIFRKYMLQINYLEKDEISDHVGYFADEMRDHLQMLKEDLADTKDELKSEKNKLKQLSQKVSKLSKPDELEEAQDEIGYTTDDVAELEKQLTAQQTEIDKFKKDKRAFLIEYVNNQLRPSD